MDGALKQRLVGAAVLVALAVIFLPMLVDGPEPESDATPVSLDLPPAPERDFETRELPLAPLPTPPLVSPDPTTAPAPTPDPDRVATVEIEPPLRPDLQPEAAPDSVTPAPPAPVAATPANPAPSAAPTPGGRFVVNLGSYANAANASSLVAALKSARLPAYTDPVQLDGKPGQRVRLGPYAQRGEAEAARLAATRVRPDVSASVVALEGDGAATAAPPVRAPVVSGFAVQLGALASETDANALRERARAAGFVAFVERTVTDAGPLWRVRVGPELERSNAEQLKTAVATKLRIDGVVVTYP
jgi:DedD protein